MWSSINYQLSTINSPMHFFRLLLWAHWRMFLAWLRGTWRESPLLIFILATLIVGYVGLGYWLFYRGLQFIYHFPLVGSLLSQRMLFMVFGFFFLMLMFSNLIIGYTTLFRNRETAWFLSLPVPARHVYRWKFFEALVVSSWALIFLSAPMMLAYGQVRRVGWEFYLQVGTLYPPFVVLPALLGSWGVVLLARYASGRRTKQVLLLAAGVAFVALIAGAGPAGESEAAPGSEASTFEGLLRHTRLSLNPYLPSAWVARSILAWSDGLSAQGWFYFLLLLSNALMGLMLGFEVVGRGFRGSWAATFSSRAARSQERVEARRRGPVRRSLLERAADLPRRWSPAGTALVLKDIRLFWRDPTQWTQFLIFFGLLCIYVANLRNVAENFQSDFWEMLISYLNLAACALTLSTLTTRFVFPQFSLEGRRIWILGLAPFGLRKVLVQKFALAFFTTATITSAMMAASCVILQFPWWKLAFFTTAIALMSGALSGLSVGLGAIFPNFKEDNPSKIVSGFGGTLCLVASFIYVTLFISLAALPDVRRLAGARWPLGELLCWSAAGLLSLAVLLAPLLFAAARVKRLEI